MAWRPVHRRGVAALVTGGFAVLVFAFMTAVPVRAQMPDVGPPFGVVTLRITSADDNGFLHDLSDYLLRYGFDVAGRPGGPVLDGRPVFLAWFKRQDGLVMLVTDIAAPQKMQTFFYGRKDGTGGDIAAELMRSYVAKMGSYPAFGAGP